MEATTPVPKISWQSAIALIIGFFAVAPALIAALPATLLYLAIHRNQLSGRASFWATYFALFWAAFGYVVISMLMSWILYVKAVWFQGYTMSLQPAWLLNYYNPRLFGDYHTIMTLLHLVSIAAAAVILRHGLRKRVSPYIKYRESLGLECIAVAIVGIRGVFLYVCTTTSLPHTNPSHD